jgi:hypothetical protein
VVNRRPLNLNTRDCTLVGPCGICGGQSGTGTSFFRVLPFSPVAVISPRFILVYYTADEQGEWLRLSQPGFEYLQERGLLSSSLELTEAPVSTR